MLEQEIEQIEIERLEAEVRRKAAEQEALAKRLCLEREAEELKLRMQREEDEANLKTKQEEEYAALQRLLDERKRKLQHLDKVKAGKNATVWPNQCNRGAKGGYNKDTYRKQSPWKCECSPTEEHTISQAANTPTNDATAELVKALGGALNARRIPIPEPSIFSGDALKYSDWKLSFHTLIDQKNIPENKKIFCLCRYVSG